MIAQEVNRRMTQNQPPGYHYGGGQNYMGNPMMGHYNGPMGMTPSNQMGQGNFNPQMEVNNNLNMQIGDQFLPTEELPMFEVDVKGVENYGEKKK